MNYYNFHIGDYRRDTTHLSMLEHGAYRQLLDMYYLNEQPIPKETQTVIRRLSARTQDEINAIEIVLKEFFIDTPDGYVHKRCDADIATYQSKAEVNRSNGKLGGRPKKTQVVNDGLNNETQNNPNQEPITNNHINTLVSNKVANCPYEQIILNFNTALPMLPAVRQLTDKRKKAILARWKEDSKRQSLEWWESFFGYVSKSDFLTGRSGNWSACCFDWIFKSENFVKIIEGNYENKP
jgi:uncharacterized protein YdaU (DUF1376 family)